MLLSEIGKKFTLILIKIIVYQRPQSNMALWFQFLTLKVCTNNGRRETFQYCADDGISFKHTHSHTLTHTPSHTHPHTPAKMSKREGWGWVELIESDYNWVIRL